ncbi:hypothetical protein DE171_000047 [Clostridium beijerinckii]|nr:hypothetical protein [Clostridium beijerinckii]
MTKAKNISEDNKNIRIFDTMPEVEISDELEKLISNVMENEFIKKSRVFDTKEGKINTLSLLILKEKFDEPTLLEGLHYIRYEIDRDFYTLSYVIRLIENM